jgi:hypothetical protein
MSRASSLTRAVLSFYVLAFVGAFPSATHAQPVPPSPNQANYWAELGYGHLEQEDHKNALNAFNQALTLDPSNEKIALDRAYTLQRLNRQCQAAEAFKGLMLSENTAFSTQACEAYSVTRGLPDAKLRKPLFAELYLAPEYNSHWNLGTLPIQLRIGATYGDTVLIEPYLIYRDTLDNRTDTSRYGSEIYNDTVSVAAAGIRAKPGHDIPITLFFERGKAYDRSDRDRERSRWDTRGGALLFKEWNSQLLCDSEAPKQRLIADLYADSVYYSRYGGNWISYLRIRPGVRLYEDMHRSVDGYIHAAFNTDSKNVIGNRFSEFGAGAAFRLHAPLRVTLRVIGIRVTHRDSLSSYSTAKVMIEHESRF